MITAKKVAGIPPVVETPPDTYSIEGLSLEDMKWILHYSCFKIEGNCHGMGNTGFPDPEASTKFKRVLALLASAARQAGVQAY